MPSTLELCEQYFGSKDAYEVLQIPKDSLEKDIKKAYYKLSLSVHPDRVAPEEKELATEKFKVLSKLHSVLTDKDKKALYDEKGIVDDDDDESKLSSWLEMWRQFFKPISTEDIDNYQREYTGSDLEKHDIKRAYLNGKGCINYMMNCVPFMSVEDEPRIMDIVKEWIASNEVPEYKTFTNEPKTKRMRRHKKYAKEAVEAKEIKEKLKGNSLEQQIMKRQNERASNADNFFDKLMEKYGGVDDSDVYVIPANGKKKLRQKSTRSSERKRGESNDKELTKDPIHRVKTGRVSKPRQNI